MVAEEVVGARGQISSGVYGVVQLLVHREVDGHDKTSLPTGFSSAIYSRDDYHRGNKHDITTYFAWQLM